MPTYYLKPSDSPLGLPDAFDTLIVPLGLDPYRAGFDPRPRLDELAGYGRKILVGWDTTNRIRDAGDGNEYNIVSGAFSPNNTDYYFLTWERYGNLWTAYSNGSIIAQATSSRTINNGTGFFMVGARDGGGTIHGLDGGADEVRVTKGVGRYQGTAFTAPTAAFPRS